MAPTRQPPAAPDRLVAMPQSRPEAPAWRAPMELRSLEDQSRSAAAAGVCLENPEDAFRSHSPC
jgi:hypothetical protein